MTQIQHRTLVSMYSTLDMLFPGITAELADRIFVAVQQEGVVLERLLSCFDPASETWLVNKKAVDSPVEVSDRLWNILTECFSYNRLTGGYFDVGLKAFKSDVSTGGELSTPNIHRTGMSAIEMDEKRHAVRFKSNHTGLDFGAIGKGLLLREIDKILLGYDVENCFISFGGSSILTRGHHPHGEYWPVTFRNGEEELPGFNMKNQFASFSRTFPKESTRGVGHIINPKTYRTISTNRSVCILSGCPVEAEVMSTTFIIASFEEAGAITSAMKPDQACIFEYDDNNNRIGEYYYGP